MAKSASSKIGRPPHKPTPTLRRQVSLLAALGHPQDVIARVVEISEATLQRYYKRELSEPLPKLVAKVAGRLVEKALKGDTTSQIFFLKTKGRFRENDPAQIVPPTIVIQTIAPKDDEPAPTPTAAPSTT